jgi:hypothetical protein
MASAERRNVSSSVRQLHTEMRIAGRPRQRVDASQQVPSCWIRWTASAVSSAGLVADHRDQRLVDDHLVDQLDRGILLELGRHQACEEGARAGPGRQPLRPSERRAA